MFSRLLGFLGSLGHRSQITQIFRDIIRKILRDIIKKTFTQVRSSSFIELDINSNLMCERFKLNSKLKELTTIILIYVLVFTPMPSLHQLYSNPKKLTDNTFLKRQSGNISKRSGYRFNHFFQKEGRNPKNVLTGFIF